MYSLTYLIRISCFHNINPNKAAVLLLIRLTKQVFRSIPRFTGFIETNTCGPNSPVRLLCSESLKSSPVIRNTWLVSKAL